MMKKKNKSRTSYSTDNTVNLIKKFGTLLEDAVPKSILGMLVTCKSLDDSVVFYSRWQLVPKEKYNYDVKDTISGETIYTGISLFSSALNIIFHLNKKITTPCPLDKIIYGLDQEYFRCLEQIRFYQKKVDKDTENSELFAIKLIDKHLRLADIKTQLSKIY